MKKKFQNSSQKVAASINTSINLNKKFFLFSPSKKSLIFIKFLQKKGFLNGFLLNNYNNNNLLKFKRCEFLYYRKLLKLILIVRFFLKNLKILLFYLGKKFQFSSFPNHYYCSMVLFLFFKIKYLFKNILFLLKLQKIFYKYYFKVNKNTNSFGICYLKYFNKKPVLFKISKFSKIPYDSVNFYQLKKLRKENSNFILISSKGILTYNDAISKKIGGFILFKIT